MSDIEHIQEAAVDFVAVPASMVTEFSMRLTQLEGAIAALKRDDPERRALMKDSPTTSTETK
jgi:hypothetical protein